MPWYKKAPVTALVLSGGGARGAYEAGVLRYIRDELPMRIKPHVRFEILCGSSVGAINCCFLAATSHIPESQGQALVNVWQSLAIDRVYQLGMRELFNLPRFLLGSRGRGELDDFIGPGRLGGLFNTSPMENLVRNEISWHRLRKNLEEGFFKAIAINATHIRSGRTHVFVEREGGGLPPWSTDPQIEAHAVEIGPNHALASGAIPWVFPAVSINGEIYSDGSIKLNTPISPALRLGADRLFVVGLRSEDVGEWSGEKTISQRIDTFPSAAYLLGKVLNALLVDKTEYDLKRLRRYNSLLKEGHKEFGDKFTVLFDDLMTKTRGAPYREIDTLEVRPSMDIAEIASRHLQRGSIAARAGSLVGPLLHRLGDIGVGQASDLLSYLLFDHEFAQELIRLGMHDADVRRQQIIEFFSV
jgi:NTE family protein